MIMTNLITYANGFEKSAIIIESIKAEDFLNRKCKPEIRERIEKISQKIKEQFWMKRVFYMYDCKSS